MIEYLNRIYTHASVTPPDAEDIHNEVLDLLRHEEYAQKVFFQIQNDPCPYHRDALLECFRRELKSTHQLIQGHVCMEHDGCTMIVWRDAEHEIKQAIRQCRNEIGEQRSCSLEDARVRQLKRTELARRVESAQCLRSPHSLTKLTGAPIDSCSLEDAAEPLLFSGRSQSELQDAASGCRLQVRGKIVQQVKSTIQQAVKDIVADIAIAPSVNIHIDRLTIPVHIHNYNAPIGQYAHHIEQQELKQ